MKSYLKTENLAVGYHGKPLIEEVSLCVQRGVNLTVCEGEMVYFIGKVGSGKSSLIKTLYAEPGNRRSSKRSSGSCRSFPARSIWTERRCARAAGTTLHGVWRF